MKVLVIAAHPDDEILGMGGTILRHRLKNDVVNVAYLATGITSRKISIDNFDSELDTNKKKWKKDISQLRKNALSASKLLKVNNAEFFDFPDNAMDSVPLLKIVKVIEKLIQKYKPDRIYTNYYNDLNIDHRTVYNATLTACRPLNYIVKELFCFEVLSSTEWNYPYTFNPNYFVNIKNQLDKKIKAMSFFKTEIQKFPHPRSKENIKLVAGRWGAISGFNAAEAFEMIRKIEK